jgi:hypothetical protein
VKGALSAISVTVQLIKLAWRADTSVHQDPEIESGAVSQPHLTEKWIKD